MGFLSSIWLFSVAAISIPILIHLWNVRPGKTLKVGSITLIEASSRKPSTSLKLLDVLLLLLRCLLLVTVAFVLAMPYIKQTSAGTSKGWLLIPKEDFKEAYQKFKPTADSLLKAGYELHYFNDGFQKVAIEQALEDTSSSAGNTAAPYWDLLRQLNRQVPQTSQLYLITPGLLSNFTGERPSISLKLNWQTYTPADSVATGIQKAWFTAKKDYVHIILATSHPSGTFFHNENWNPVSVNTSLFVFNVSDGKAFINPKNRSGMGVEIDSVSLKIDVFAGTNPQDAGYVEAALQAVAQFTQQNIEVKYYDKNARGKRDWLFWLNDKPVPNGVFNRYQNVLVYDGGKTLTTNSWINGGERNIALYKSVLPASLSGESKWQDGFGNPILTMEVKGKTMVYHFYSRFNPAWNDLVWNPDFPQLMQQLPIPSGEKLNNLLTDKRVIDSKQIQPNIAIGNSSPGSYVQNANLVNYFWMLLMLLFVTERWLAHKKTEGAAEV